MQDIVVVPRLRRDQFELRLLQDFWKQEAGIRDWHVELVVSHMDLVQPGEESTCTLTLDLNNPLKSIVSEYESKSESVSCFLAVGQQLRVTDEMLTATQQTITQCTALMAKDTVTLEQD